MDVGLSKYQKFGEIADAPVEIVRISDDSSWYSTGAHSNNSNSLVYAVHYKPTVDRLEQMENHETEKG